MVYNPKARHSLFARVRVCVFDSVWWVERRRVCVGSVVRFGDRPPHSPCRVRFTTPSHPPEPPKTTLITPPKQCQEGPGCGEWVRPMKSNPAYKGKWSAPMIDNPEYKGEWAPKRIGTLESGRRCRVRVRGSLPGIPGILHTPPTQPTNRPTHTANPAFFTDETPYILPPMSALAVEVWTTNRGLRMDSFVVGHDASAALAYAQTTWKREWCHAMDRCCV